MTSAGVTTLERLADDRFKMLWYSELFINISSPN